MSALAKRCPKCGEEKPLTLFARDSSRRDGLQPHCKACKRAYHVASYTPEKGRQAHEAKRAADPDGYKAKRAEAMARWREANPERAREIAREAARRQLAKRSGELNARRREKWASDPEFVARATAVKRASYLRHRESILTKQKARIAADPARKAASDLAWRLANPERKKASRKAHYEANKERWRAYSAARKAAKLRATPGWMESEAIRAFYMATPDGHQVDHIVPLQGKTVCGLHCLANLQYLPATENASKRHLWWPDMPVRDRRAA